MMHEPEDVFVSHAWEDKDSIVRPLVDELDRLGVTSWYDESSLRLGDSLREKIDQGLARTRYGIVILSPDFFRKGWPREELAGMFSRQTADGAYRILPVWHNVNRAEVAKYSPMLAGKLATATATGDGLARVAAKIQEAVRGPLVPVDPESYAHVHKNETITLASLPRAYGFIQNHYLYRCHLVGPAVMAVLSHVDFLYPRVPSPEVAFPLTNGRRYFGMIGVRDSAFVECRFEEVGIALPTDAYDMFIAGGGDFWFVDPSSYPPNDRA